MNGWISSFFNYETTKSVVVKSWIVGIINRIAQLLIIIYFVCYVFLHEKAYQVRDTGIESAVMTKVKGVGMLNDTMMDVADYVVPTQGASVFCIIIKMVKTENQRQEMCAEPDPQFKCSTDEDCKNHRFSNVASGYVFELQNLSIKRKTCSVGADGATIGKMTGKCMTAFNQCEIIGWCPAEDDRKITKHMQEAENFTIYVKNTIRFPRFNITRTNILPSVEKKGLKCKYDPVDDPYCPIFRVGDVIKYADGEFSKISEKGGEIGINIGWMCNLDKPITDCNPKYTFTRLDSALKDSYVTKGYNFRFAKYYMLDNGTMNIEYRTLHKVYAIRFDIVVSGNAGKFGAIPTIINVVAAFTSVGLASVLSDIILLNFLKGAKQYKAKKFEEISGFIGESRSSELYKGSKVTIKAEKNSYDSGDYTTEHHA